MLMPISFPVVPVAVVREAVETVEVMHIAGANAVAYKVGVHKDLYKDVVNAVRPV